MVRKLTGGRRARDKGSRAERKVRDMLKTIYPQEYRNNINRIPMSGAGYIKGDVSDSNDPDSCYEVKNQEQLHLHEWWRQTKSQAGVNRTPVLVVTQSYRPYYFILNELDWTEMVSRTPYNDVMKSSLIKTGSKFFDDLAELDEREVGSTVLDDDPVYIVPSQFYIEVKSWLFQSMNSNIK